MRLFVAVNLPDDLRSALGRLVDRLPAGHGVRWVPPGNVHLTLRFLGEVSPDRVEEIETLLSAAAARHPAFTLTAQGVGAFPDLRRPRVVWVGIGPPESIGTLDALHRDLEDGFADLGFGREGRPFRPHLTIGRVRDRRGRRRTFPRGWIEGAAFPAAPFSVDAIDLMESRLEPAGARYRRLHRALLGRR
jgi:2'-5' RNA ligase